MGIRIKQQNGMHNVKVKNPVQQSDIIVHTTGTSASVKANDNTDDLAIGLAKDWAIKTDGTVNGVEYSSKYYALLAQEFVNETMVPATSTKLGVVKVGNKLSVTEDGTLSANTYSTEELNSLLLEKADISDIPTNVSELNNDLDYVTQVGLNNQLANYTAPLAPATSSTLGGVKIGGGINVSSDGTISASTRNIGEIVSSTIPLTDAGLHLLDGALIQGDGIYSAFVDYIASIVSTYPSVFTTESAWQSSVSTYGVCGKFVYDSTNNTVRLPKITGILEGTTDVNALGDLVQAGLPQHTHTRGSMNITGDVGYTVGNNANATGAFTKDANSNSPWWAGATDVARASIFHFTASRAWTGSTSTPDYSDSSHNNSTVQPQTIKVLYYIVVATSTKTDIEVDIDNVVTDLNGKADRDLTNVTDTAKVMMSGMGMPSNERITLTLGASGSTYTAPANGWVMFSKKGTAGQTIVLRNINSNMRVQTFQSTSSENWNGIILPVKKNDTFAVEYTCTGATMAFIFIYAVGSESEAS